MSLNIKNEKTHRLIRQLARVTGESMTAAVEKAVEERLERIRKTGTDEDGLAERLMKIAQECSAHLKEPYKSMDINELLYDENGMPK